MMLFYHLLPTRPHRATLITFLLIAVAWAAPGFTYNWHWNFDDSVSFLLFMFKINEQE